MMQRTIWFYWSQGMDQAPLVVRKCYQSWADRNPGWRIATLDAGHLAEVGSLDYGSGVIAGLPPNKRADLLRLDLLAHHGGVWADATCFCVQPLDQWLPDRLDSGFFAFDRPGPDRILSSWFLAAHPGNLLAARMFAFMRAYWATPVRREHPELMVRVATRLLQNSPHTRSWWFSPPLRQWLGASPYFALHYAFEKMIRDDPGCAGIWGRTPRISADGPHGLLATGLLAPATPEIRDEIDHRRTPVYKTTWKLDSPAIAADTVLGYLLATVPG
jgi:Capsular polysaccharide synthesis protein